MAFSLGGHFFNQISSNSFLIFTPITYPQGDYHQCLLSWLATSICNFTSLNTFTCLSFGNLSPHLSLMSHITNETPHYIVLFSMPSVPLLLWDPYKIMWVPHLTLLSYSLWVLVLKSYFGKQVTLSWSLIRALCYLQIMWVRHVTFSPNSHGESS